MENTSELSPVSERDLAYYNRRNQNRLFEALTSFFAEEAERRGIFKKDICDAIRRDPAWLTRLLSHPSNMTADTVSTFLLPLEAEMDYRVVRFSDRLPANEMHPLMARVLVREAALQPRVEKKLAPPVQRFQKLATPTGSAATIAYAD